MTVIILHNINLIYCDFQQPPVATPMMTPLMTPSYHGNTMAGTPGQPLTTPGQPIATPSQGGAMTTPQYQPTPRSSWNQPGGTTPATMTPRHVPTVQSRPPVASTATPKSTTDGLTPGSTTPGKHTPSAGTNKTAMDWAKAAEMWRKQMETQATHRQRTPGQSPMVGGSTPGGGGTPLFDER